MLACALGLTLCAAFWSGPGFAKALTVTDADPIAVVTFPDNWRSAKVKRGVEVKSPDEEVYVWLEVATPGEMDALQKEHDKYFADQGVKITSSSETVKNEVNGRMWSFTELKAKHKDGDQIIRYMAINPNLASGKIILMTYWASMAGHKDHDKAMSAAIKSLAFK
jgi:hypothetical protein